MAANGSVDEWCRAARRGDERGARQLLELARKHDGARAGELERRYGEGDREAIDDLERLLARLARERKEQVLQAAESTARRELARRGLQSSDIDDYVQELLARLLEALPESHIQFESFSGFAKWRVLGILKDSMKKWHHRARAEDSERILEERPGLGPRIEAALEREDVRDAYRECTQGLTSLQREVCQLRLEEGLSYETLARRLGRDPTLPGVIQNLRARQFEGLQRIRQCMKRKGVGL